MDKTEQILNELEPLYKRAKEEGLWFFSNYQQLWFSPKELRDYQSEGNFIWGACNWILRDPIEKLMEMENKKNGIEREIIDFKNKIGQ